MFIPPLSGIEHMVVYKGILLMVWPVVPDDMGVWGFHRCASEVDTLFPWMAYERPMDDVLMK